MFRSIFNEGVHSNFSSLGLLLLRVTAGGMLAVGHGWDKLVNFGAMKENFPSVWNMGSSMSLTMAIVGELLCPVLVILGLATRLAVIPVVTTMGMAIVTAHARHPVFPSQDGGPAMELALMYMIPFLPLFFTGAGRYSIDRKLFNDPNF